MIIVARCFKLNLFRLSVVPLIVSGACPVEIKCWRCMYTHALCLVLQAKDVLQWRLLGVSEEISQAESKSRNCL